MSEKSNIFGMTIEELKLVAEKAGQPSYRGKQVFQWLYVGLATTFEEMSNIPEKFRNYLEKNYVLKLPQIVDSFKSNDGSIKYLFQLHDSSHIETVLMPTVRYNAICISSQAGCPLNCSFCATGKSGFTRNLECGEIIGQVGAILKNSTINRDSLNILFMGMGEPLLNIDNVMKAFYLLNKGFNIAASRMTLSTAGIVPGINELINYKKRPNLSVSLNAVTDQCRNKIMPINRKYNLQTLLSALKNYSTITGNTVTIEFVMLSQINDSNEDAVELAKIASDLKAKVNLIPYNGGSKSILKAPSEKNIHSFQKIIKEKNITVTLRNSRGRDIMAACGQLSQKMPNLQD